MIENISVDTALKKGHKIFLIPGIIVLVIMLLLFVSSFYMMVNDFFSPWFLLIMFPGGFLPMIIILWFLRSIKIPDWKLWAFEHVRNVHELEKRALQERLIYDAANLFTKTEIWTEKKKAKWEILKEKFQQEDIFIDDLTVPSETLIFYSKFQSRFEIGFVIFMLLMGVALSIIADNYFAAYLVGVFAIFAAYIVYTRHQRANSTKPQITINEKGIETISTPFQNWNVIKNEEAIVEIQTKNSKSYLIFDFPKGKERLRIDDFNTSVKSLNHLLRIYRGRSSFKNHSSNSHLHYKQHYL